MAILKIIARKMINNRWLTGSLFLGLLITVSLVSSIPTYTSSVMQKLLIKELEQYQIDKGQFPGEFSFSASFTTETEKKPFESLKKVEKINKDIQKEAELPILEETTILKTSPLKISHHDEARRNTSGESQQFGRIVTLTNIEEHITVTDGELPSGKIEDGVIEVLVPEKALQKRDLVLNTLLTAQEGNERLIIKPVGTFKAKDIQNSYWVTPPDGYSDDFIVLEKLFRKEFLKEGVNLLGTGKFYTAFDYQTITNDDIPKLLQLEDKIDSRVSKVNHSMLLVSFPAADILSKYMERGQQLTTMLWSLNVPVLIMLGIYLFMVSRLIINRQLNEIAVLASRGAKRSQITFIYFIEISFLGLIAFLLGPYIGLFICKVLGATNGFMEFVQRSSLQIEIMSDSYVYGLIAVVSCIVMTMIPVYHASKQSIVSHKQNLVQIRGSKNWIMMIVNLLLIGISVYGLYTFQRRQKEMLSITKTDGELFIDPMLFFIPALFIIGLGLLILRLYPIVLKGIYKLGEKYWSLPLYSTFIEVSRSSKQYRFLMLFLVMTIGIGVFSASAARTINSNLEQQIRYENGADIVVQTKWESNEPAAAPAPAMSTGLETSPAEEALAVAQKQVVYSEPPFEPFAALKGIEHAAKVFKKENIAATGAGKNLFSAELMGIEPKEFGQTAWFKSSLLPHHWYEYLNMLAKEPSAVLISKSVASSLKVKEGDYISLKWDASDTAEFVVFGIIDYWPAFNPLQSENEEEIVPYLIVANLPYVQNMMGLEPYEVWMKTSPDFTRNALYEDIKKLNIPIIGMEDVYPKVLALKNSAFLMGLNGTLTLGFIISIVITFIGFLLYWVLTIKSRTLQFGIFRAMGIPMRKLVGMLVWEQLFTSGMACGFGIMIGGITSKLFVPLFQQAFDPKKMVPPFQVTFSADDEVKIYMFVSFMLIVGLAILVIFLKRIRIHQAIKLGED